MRSRSYIGGFR